MNPESAMYSFFGADSEALAEQEKQGTRLIRYAASKYEKYSNTVVGDFTPAADAEISLLGDTSWAGFD
jgi:hypothetical protein